MIRKLLSALAVAFGKWRMANTLDLAAWRLRHALLGTEYEVWLSKSGEGRWLHARVRTRKMAIRVEVASDILVWPDDADYFSEARLVGPHSDRIAFSVGRTIRPPRHPSCRCQPLLDEDGL